VQAARERRRRRRGDAAPDESTVQTNVFLQQILDGARLIALCTAQVFDLVLQLPDLGQSDLDVLALERRPRGGEVPQRTGLLGEVAGLGGVTPVMEGVDEDCVERMTQAVLLGEKPKSRI
jgi:hypothetical protein